MTGVTVVGLGRAFFANAKLVTCVLNLIVMLSPVNVVDPHGVYSILSHSEELDLYTFFEFVFDFPTLYQLCFIP